jgi:CubicO group peptidase (beta-lactamase class C family)
MDMRWGRNGIALLAAIGLASLPPAAMAQAKPTEAGMSAARIERMTQVVDKYVAEGALPGAVILVHRKGHLAHVVARGYQDIAKRTPMRRDTIFALASMTKPITAVATMMLIEDGKLRLDEPVDRLLPELANRKVLVDPAGQLTNVRPSPRPITVRDLLTYRMGIGVPGYAGIPESAPITKAYAGLSSPGTTADEYMARLGELPLVYTPGDRFMYNTPSTVLGVLIARASGMPYERFLETRIFRPLGMNDTAFYVPAEKRDRVATVYSPGPDGRLVATDREAPSAPPVFPSPSGGLYSTADDYLAFARMLLNKGKLGGVRILSRTGVELMTRDYLHHEAPESYFISKDFFSDAGFGYGFQVQTRQTGYGPSPGSYWWNGATGVSWYADPVEDMAVVNLIQRMGSYAPYAGDLGTALHAAIDD